MTTLSGKLLNISNVYLEESKRLLKEADKLYDVSRTLADKSKTMAKLSPFIERIGKFYPEYKITIDTDILNNQELKSLYLSVIDTQRQRVIDFIHGMFSDYPHSDRSIYTDDQIFDGIKSWLSDLYDTDPDHMDISCLYREGKYCWDNTCPRDQILDLFPEV